MCGSVGWLRIKQGGTGEHSHPTEGRPFGWYHPEMSPDEIREAASGFYQTQIERCTSLGIDVGGLPVGHLAYRCRTWSEYVRTRDALELQCRGNLENVWNGRPISKMLLRDPIPLIDGVSVDLIELIPPFHQRVYRMGLEHIGIVVGDDFDDFAVRHRSVLTGQQFQSDVNEPLYVLFPEDYTHVKFHKIGLGEVCRLEGLSFDGFTHAQWTPADPDAGPYQVD